MRKSLFFANTCVGLCFVETAQVDISAPGTVSYSFNASNTIGISSLQSGWKISSAGTVAYWTACIIVTAISRFASTGNAKTRGWYHCGTSSTDSASGFLTVSLYLV